MKLTAGALGRVLSLYSIARTSDAAGQPIEAETLVATVYGERLELRANDIARMAGQKALQSGRYLIRWRAGLTTKHRVHIEGTVYKITGIDEPDRRRTLILTVEAMG